MSAQRSPDPPAGVPDSAAGAVPATGTDACCPEVSTFAMGPSCAGVSYLAGLPSFLRRGFGATGFIATGLGSVGHEDATVEDGPVTGVPEGNKTAGTGVAMGFGSDGFPLATSVSAGGCTASAMGLTISSNLGHALGASSAGEAVVVAVDAFAGLFGGGRRNGGVVVFFGEGDKNLGLGSTLPDLSTVGEGEDNHCSAVDAECFDA